MSKGRGSAREGWVRHHQQRSRAKPQTEKEVPPPKPMSAVTTSQAIELAETDIDAAEASLAEALLAHFEQQETCLEDALVALSALPAAPAIDHGDLERENREASERRAQRAAKFGTGSQQQEAGHNGSPAGHNGSPQLDAFEAAILLCEARELLPPDSTVDLSDDVPRLLHQAFDQDFEQLLLREKVVTNVTCMQPADEGCGSELFNDELLKLTLKPGRVCEGGACGEACSRVAFPLFASPHECEAFRELLESSMTPPLHHFELAKCAFRSLRTTLVFVRLIERMRRAIAHEYGLPLATVVPAQAFVACLAGAQEKKQGGLHADESSFAEFHYSCVLYLSTHSEDFHGGTFAFNDPQRTGTAITGASEDEAAPAAAEQSTPEATIAEATIPEESTRTLRPMAPSIGSALIFSSGWENMHEVSPLLSGTRFAVPAFFRTQPVEQAWLQTGFEAVDDAAIARELWRTILSPQSGRDVQQFMLNWHALLAPGWRVQSVE